LNVDAILIFDAYWAAAPPPSPAAQLHATSQPMIATAGTRSVGIDSISTLFTTKYCLFAIHVAYSSTTIDDVTYHFMRRVFIINIQCCNACSFALKFDEEL